VSKWIKNLETGGKGAQMFKPVPARAAGIEIRVCNVIEGVDCKEREGTHLVLREHHQDNWVVLGPAAAALTRRAPIDSP